MTIDTIFENRLYLLLIRQLKTWKKQFCSDQCRMDRWNAHPNKVKREAFYTLTYAFCGNAFTSYGNRNRKYCCHECYIYDRYSKGA